MAFSPDFLTATKRTRNPPENAHFSQVLGLLFSRPRTRVLGLKSALPEGADVAFFANCTELEGTQIVKWIYADGTEVEGMPTDDVEVYAVFDFEVEDNEDVEKVYLADGTVATVTDPADLQWDANYELYKVNGEASELVLAADDGVFDISAFKVADSGEYFIKVIE